MKIFIWQGKGVLEEWGTGLAIAYAESLEEALKQMRDEHDTDMYTDDWLTNNLPKEPSKVIDCELDHEPFSTFLWGSS